jgi:hypothetical protein
MSASRSYPDMLVYGPAQSRLRSEVLLSSSCIFGFLHVLIGHLVPLMPRARCPSVAQTARRAGLPRALQPQSHRVRHAAHYSSRPPPPRLLPRHPSGSSLPWPPARPLSGVASRYWVVPPMHPASTSVLSPSTPRARQPRPTSAPSGAHRWLQALLLLPTMPLTMPLWRNWFTQASLS